MAEEKQKAQRETQKVEEKPKEQSKAKVEEKPKTETKLEAPEITAKKETKAQGEPEKPKVELSKKAEQIMTSIEDMTVLELSNLVKALEEKFGVSAAVPAMAQGIAVAGVGAPGAPGAAAEEKTTFDVVLAEVGANKIQVIKEIRAVTNLGLKEAKDLVDQAPKPIKEGLPKEEAEEVKKKVEAVGAKVELK